MTTVRDCSKIQIILCNQCSYQSSRYQNINKTQFWCHSQTFNDSFLSTIFHILLGTQAVNRMQVLPVFGLDLDNSHQTIIPKARFNYTTERPCSSAGIWLHNQYSITFLQTVSCMKPFLSNIKAGQKLLSPTFPELS